MEIWHRVNLEPEAQSVLQAWEVRYKPEYSLTDPTRVSYVLFDISESHPAWPDIKALVQKSDSFNFVWTEFTEQEVLSAEWLVAAAVHSIGRPAMKDPWSSLYYERGCATCGVGWRQKAPFTIQKEPRLGKNVFANFWGAFELFCTDGVLETFERAGIRGYEVWPVLLHKTREPSQVLRQLIVSSVAKPAFVEELAETERSRKEVCPTCGNVWHIYYTRGMMPLRRSALRQNVDFQLTYEWFGGGRTARREILVSQRVARLVVQQKWKGLVLWPIRLV